MGVLERDIERYLIKKVKGLGGCVRKIKWMGRNGAPDRLILLKGSHFVELKRPKGGRLSAGQKREAKIFSEHSVKIHHLKTYDEVDDFLNEICSKKIPRDSDQKDQGKA